MDQNFQIIHACLSGKMDQRPLHFPDRFEGAVPQYCHVAAEIRRFQAAAERAVTDIPQRGIRIDLSIRHIVFPDLFHGNPFKSDLFSIFIQQTVLTADLPLSGFRIGFCPVVTFQPAGRIPEMAVLDPDTGQIIACPDQHLFPPSFKGEIADPESFPPVKEKRIPVFSGLFDHRFPDAA